MRPNSIREFFPERYALRLSSSMSVEEIFELVRDAVKEQVGVVRAGMELGLADLEEQDGKVPLALHLTGCNLIVINSAAAEMARARGPDLLRSMLFHALLHEYMKTIGLVAEPEVGGRVQEISQALFGNDHSVTRLSRDLEDVLPGTAHAKSMPLDAIMKVRPASELRLDASDS